MPKPHNGEKNSGKNGSQRKNGTSRSNEKSSLAKSKAILTLKPARKPELTIKATFEDKNGNEVKELIYRYDEVLLTQINSHIVLERYQFGHGLPILTFLECQYLQ